MRVYLHIKHEIAEIEIKTKVIICVIIIFEFVISSN